MWLWILTFVRMTVVRGAVDYPQRRMRNNAASYHSVTLTKVRAQGHGCCAMWLWILTFVRMTGFEEITSPLGAILNLRRHPRAGGDPYWLAVVGARGR